MEQHNATGGEDNVGLDRLLFFSDAVIAIAITLLALDLRLPPLGEGADNAAVAAALLALWPQYTSFLTSFSIIGIYWWVHHRSFRMVRRYDEGLIALNLLFLLCIVLLPFASSVLGEHFDAPAAVVFYALIAAITGFVEAFLWIYITHKGRLVAQSLTPRAIRFATARSFTPPSIILLSIPLVLLRPYAAALAWIAICPIIALLFHREQHRDQQTKRGRRSTRTR